MFRTITATFPALLWLSILAAQAQPTFTISTIAGTGIPGYSGDGGPAINAMLNNPLGVAVDADENIYIADENNNRIRKIAPDGTITTVAGSGVQGFSGDGGPAINAALNLPIRVSLDSAGNVYIAGNDRVREVSNGIITTIAGNGKPGFSGDGGSPLSASMSGTSDVVPDNAGNIYIVDPNNYRVRGITNGIITTVAGNGVGTFSGDGGPATAASLTYPAAIAVDSTGTLFIADRDSQRVRKVAGGIITTVAGTGTAGFSGDGGPAINARLNQPAGIHFDAAGNLYIPELSNNRIRVLLTDGTIATVAGNGVAGFSGDGGMATSAALNSPRTVAVGPSGRIYIADYSNHRIRMLTPVPQPPAVSSVISASPFGGLSAVAPGSWIEIHGAGLASDSRGWNSGDFSGMSAPTMLDGTSVSIGGQAAFIEYISPAQVNAQAPSGVSTGQQQVTVTSPGGTSAPFTVTVNTTAPGLFAPSSLSIGGTQYVGAYFASNLTPIFTPGDVLSSGSLRMKPGDTIILYGIGFGPVTPDSPAGQIVQQANTLAATPQFSLGGVPATLVSAGLVSGAIGLYQFNITVPNVSAGDAVPLTFTLGGVPGTQALYIAVGN